MRRVLGGAALLVVVACVVWAGVLWQWSASGRDPSTADIVLWLVALPLVLVALLLASGWAWRGFRASEAARAEAAAASSAAAPASAAAASSTAPSSDAAARHGVVRLLGAHVLTAAGSSVRDLLSAAEENAPRPTPDAELRDDDGLPLLSARIPDLEPASIEAETAAELAAARASTPEWQDAPVDACVWRALAALRQPLDEAVAGLSAWSTALSVAPETADARAAAVSLLPLGRAADGAGAPSETAVTGGPRPVREVRVLVGWPLTWQPFEQALARDVVASWLAEGAAAAMPGVRFAVEAEAMGGAALLQHADRHLQAALRAGRHDPLLIAACHSTIGAEPVQAMELAGTLHRAGLRPKGRIPAEAAAVLVVAGPAWPAADGGDDAAVHLHRPAVLARDKSIDAPGRVTAAVAGDALAQALVAARLESRADEEGALRLVGDADQHSERAAELFGAAGQVLPGLDPSEDVVAFGHVTGAIGAVAALATVAAAAERARADGVPCMALSVGDPQVRLALVALPGPPVASDVPGDASAPASGENAARPAAH